MRIFLISIFLFVSLLGVSAGTVVPPSLPLLPAAYSATVVATYVHLNFTVAWEEFFDNVTTPSTPHLRTNGRFAPSNTAELLIFGDELTSQIWNVDDPNGECTASSIDQLSYSRQLSPSSTFLTERLPNLADLTYQGVSESASTRYVSCDVWSGTASRSSSIYGNSTWSFTYYAAVPATVGLERAPIRLEVQGYQTIFINQDENGNNLNDSIPITYSFHIYYDWVDFSFQIPSPSVFTLPFNCPSLLPGAGSTLPLRSFNTSYDLFPNSTLPSAPLPDVNDFPSLPLNFKLIMEAKLDPLVSTDDDAGTSWEVETYHWSINTELGSDRLDFAVLSDESNVPTPGLIVGTGQASRIEISNSSAIGGATVYSFRAQLDESSTSHATCITNALSWENISPLDSQRAGSLRNLFSSDTSNIKYHTATKVERVTLRGIEVDKYTTGPHIKLNGNNLFQFEQDVYFYNSLWRLPGRLGIDFNQGEGRLPLRVVNRGSFINASFTTTPIEYTDIYDFFLILPNIATEDIFSPSQWIDVGANCPPPPVLSSDVKFPSINDFTSYSTSISVSILNKGYTLTSSEKFNGQAQKLRANGRIGPTSNELIDITAGKAYLWLNQVDEITGNPIENNPCWVAPYIPNSPSSRMQQPALRYFTQFSSLFNNNKNYVGRGSDANSRYILADRWQVATGYTSGNNFISNFSIIFYISVPAKGIDAVPLRISLSGYSAKLNETTGEIIQNSVQVFSHVYDFINFYQGPILASEFFLPQNIIENGCQIVDVYPSIFNLTIPQTPFNTPKPDSTPPLPSATPLSSVGFNTLLEAKILTPGQLTANEVYTIEWKMDKSNSIGPIGEKIITKERLTRLAPKEKDQSTQIIYYTRYPSQGNSFTLLNNGTCTFAPFNTSAGIEIEESDGSDISLPAALWSEFQGALLSALVLDPLVNFWRNPPGYLHYKTSNELDLEIQSDRGIACDVYTTSRISTNPDGMSYSSIFYENIPSWIWIGRNNSLPRPVRVHVTGISAGNVSSTDRGFEAVMDLYQYVAGKQSIDDFALNISCSNYNEIIDQMILFYGTGENNGGSPSIPDEPDLGFTSNEKIGIGIGLFLCIGLIGLIGWWGFCRKTTSQRRAEAMAATGGGDEGNIDHHVHSQLDEDEDIEVEGMDGDDDGHGDETELATVRHVHFASDDQ
jgi:hypothetical protein